MTSRSGRLWLLFFTGSTAVVAWLMQYYAFEHWPRLTGATREGLTFGIIGTSLILVAFLYVIRKYSPGIGVGHLKTWLHGHIYLGALALVFILAHSGYKFHAAVPNTAFILLLLVVLSGIVGWGVFIKLPEKNLEVLDGPVNPEKSCERLTEIHEKLTELCSGRSEELLEIYNDVVIPLYRTLPNQMPMEVNLAQYEASISQFADFEDLDSFEKLSRLVLDARKHLVLLALNYKFVRSLKIWLLFHIPLSIGLFVFTATHITSVVMVWVRGGVYWPN